MGNCSQNIYNSKLLLHILVAHSVNMIVIADGAAGRKEIPISGMNNAISILFSFYFSIKPTPEACSSQVTSGLTPD